MSLHSIITAALASGILAGSSHAITIFGLGAGGQLFSFDSGSPGSFTPVGTATATGIVDIDFRGSNNRLYGINASGDTSTINTSNGQVTFASSPLSSLGGNVSGFDFNPAVDRMRIAVGGVNNFRVTPEGNPMSPVGTVSNDASFSLPLNTTILDVAYKNPFNGILGTSLFSIASDGNLYLHDGSPQFNTLVLKGATGLSFTPGSNIGFDIDAGGTGYLVSGTSFYTVNLDSGLASFVGNLDQALTSIAVVPEPSSMILGSIAGLALLRRRRNA